MIPHMTLCFIWYRMSEKLAAAHRKTLLEGVLQSMAFENEPIDMARLKTLLKKKKAANRQSRHVFISTS